MTSDPAGVAAVLGRAGFVRAEDEALELVRAAAGDEAALAALVARRLTGEPLAWIRGTTTFGGLDINVHPGVYVPRPQTELLVRRGAQCLPSDGTALDLCTGSGAIAKSLAVARPQARILASDIDARAVACARSNGVDALLGDLFAPFSADLHGRVDLVIASVPYVPTPALALLQRDTFTFEPATSYDGGAHGVDVLRRVFHEGRRFLRPGGAVVVELGGDQASELGPDLARLGYTGAVVRRDEESDVCGLETRYSLPA